ncbi:MAG: 2-amino-4-hydroxy-6-hydroxymethyldihydropteridine diphosphokinase [Brevinematales bacterium]|nr:2-amino-4-hydroxy-6-hydroxymethyldihydropteridine diphosphokinase [Brevinematales bacterium]
MKRKRKIILSIGSNVEPRYGYILSAIEYLREGVSIIKLSSIYETDPWGYSKQDRFLNLCVFAYTHLKPFELLRFVKDVERLVGRKETFRWGPREIDIDIVYYDSLIVDTDNLIIPHPGRLERNFVMVPLFEIYPSFVDPEYGVSVSWIINKYFDLMNVATLLKSRFL